MKRRGKRIGRYRSVSIGGGLDTVTTPLLVGRPGISTLDRPPMEIDLHYYQFNIGDYTSHTAHLDHIEDIAYRRMLDWYYTHEKPLPIDVQEIARLVRMRDYPAQIRDVLNEFFELTDDGWFSSRVQREIDHYRAKVEQASKAGKASAERRLNGRSTDVQQTNNHKPITKSQQTVLKNTGAVAPVDVDPKLWSDFLQIRKAKRSPLTATALEAIKREADKAGWTLSQALTECVTRGWQGFKADWVSKQQAADKPQKFDPFEFVNKGRKDNVVIDITPTA